MVVGTDSVPMPFNSGGQETAKTIETNTYTHTHTKVLM